MSRSILINNTAKALLDQKRSTRSAMYRAGQAVFEGAGKRTPMKTRRLRQQTQVKQMSDTNVELTWGALYAAVQNLGKRRGARPFKKYTTAGTGPGFVEVGVQFAKARVKRFFS